MSIYCCYVRIVLLYCFLLPPYPPYALHPLCIPSFLFLLFSSLPFLPSLLPFPTPSSLLLSPPSSLPLISPSPQSYQKRSITANICPAPFLNKPAQPHLLVCAPSNAGIDEIVRRLLDEGLVMNTQQWRLKQAEKVNEVVMAKWCANVVSTYMCVHV